MDLGGGGDVAGALSPMAPTGRRAPHSSPALQEGQGHGAAAEADAQLRRAAAEVFGDRVPIRVRRCTQLASTSLERQVLDVQLEGVAMGWAGIFLPSTYSRVPDCIWERVMRRNQAAPCVPMGPRDRLVRVLATGQRPAADPPVASSSAPQLGQPAKGDVDMAAPMGSRGLFFFVQAQQVQRV